jgi:predicted phage terminase large subunit-like protein
MLTPYDQSLLRNLLPNNLNAFAQAVFNRVSPNADYTHNWHIDCICEHLMACYRKEITRLIINIAPRSMKSILCSVAFPAWVLGQNPKEQIINASYARSVSNKFSLDTRNIIQSEFYKTIFPNTKLAPDQNEKSKFMTTERGHRLAASVGSAVTAEGGNILLVDDPLNPQQASSEVERATANEWFSSTFYSRLNDKRPGKGVIIVIMQRLHQNDLTGHLLKEGGWDHLCLPAVNDRTRTITIGNFTKEWKEGELLNSILLTDDALEKTKQSMGSIAFAAQYMQRPTPKEGAIFRTSWWQLWKGNRPPKSKYIIQIYDTAFGTKQSNDYSARTTWSIFEDEETGLDNIILMERWQQRVDFPSLKQEAFESCRKYKPDLILVENKASGQPLIDEMRRMRLPVRAIKRDSTSGDKIARAHMSTPSFEQKAVWVPAILIDENDQEPYWRPLKWAQEIINECAMFPNGEHDDLVDTVIDAVLYLRKKLSLDNDVN